MNKVEKILFIVLAVTICGCQSSNRDLNTKATFQTGMKSFDKKTTHFEAYEQYLGEVPPGCLPIEGGTFTIGQQSEFITAPHNNERRSLTVSSFYMDKYEVTNIAWREYEHWMEYVFGAYRTEIVAAVIPDSLVWRDPMAYNEPYEENYYRHPAYSFYPVVGVSWKQAMAYCQWRSDRVNEMKLIALQKMEQADYSILDPNKYMSEQAISDFLQLNDQHPEYAKYQKEAIQVPLSQALENGYEGEETPEVDEYGRESDPEVTMYRVPYEWVRDHFVFNTEKYLQDSRYRPTYGRTPSENAYGKPRKVTRADGILFLGYRLPTEAEWEYAALCPVADEDGVPTEGRMYPWSGYHPRDMGEKRSGMMQANFTRGKGDMAGIAGAPNDGYVLTAPVDAFAANDFGLYNMAGNVNEWVLDVYRDETYDVFTEFNPYRGNVYARLKRDADNHMLMNATGCFEIEFGDKEDKRNFREGDKESLFETDYPLDTTVFLAGLTPEERATKEYKIDPTDILIPRVDNHSHIYKGGSWNDRIYWLDPATRRFMDENGRSSTIGFRCAMTMLGDQAQALKK